MQRNKKLFYEVADLIERYPHMHDQRDFLDGDEISILFNGKIVHCYSTHCVSGWGAVLNGESPDTSVVDTAEMFGLTELEADSLFFQTAGMTTDGDWPNLLRALGDGMTLSSAYDRFMDPPLAASLKKSMEEMRRNNASMS